MLKYISRRLLMLIPILIGVSLIVFTLMYFTPGNPAKLVLGESAPEEAIEELTEEMGLNDSFVVQYARYMKDLIVHQDLGESYITKRPVMSEIAAAFPSTLKLAVSAVCVAIVVGIPIGIISAVKRYTLFDNIAMIFALIGISMPVFWLGLLLILLFSVKLNVLPSSGFGSFKYMILPAVSLAAQSVAVITRMTRSSMLEVLGQDYVKTAKAKGQKNYIVIIKHALRNALIPITTSIGLQFGGLLGGAVLTETIFSIPGIGRLMVESIKMRDFPVVQGSVLVIAVTFSVVNLLVDLFYAYVDPRVRTQYK